VVLRTYFDAGNKADSAQYDILSLALIAGTAGLWKPFERDWKRALRRHKAAYLHTTDAVARKGIYKGWTEPQRDSFLLDLSRIGGKHGARATIGQVEGKYGLYCFVISIVLKDFIECAKSNPKASKNAEEACFRQSLWEILTWSEEQAASEECHCFFDRGEPFYGHLVHMLESKKALRGSPLLRKVTVRREADSRRTPALQLADLYAWCQSHRNAEWQPKWQKKLLNTHFRWNWIDKTNVNDINEDHQNEFLAWNLPKRKPTT
jgi:hypothetical protein